jgi:hypothetical protein
MKNEAPKQPRWYQWAPPPWCPTWVVTCSAVGALACVAFWFGLGGLSLKALAITFAVGFGATVFLLALMFGRMKPEDQRTGMFPPIWARLPVIASLFVFMGAAWVCEERITIHPSRWRYVIVEGAGAVVLGFALMTLPATWNAWRLYRKPRHAPEAVGAIAALLVVAVGYGVAIHHLAMGGP